MKVQTLQVAEKLYEAQSFRLLKKPLPVFFRSEHRPYPLVLSRRSRNKVHP